MRESIKLMLIFSIICSFVLFNATSVHADLIVPGTKSIISCYKVSNVGDYPDYVFLMYPVGVGAGYQTITSDSCLAFYKLVSPSIYAVKKTDFSESDIGENYTLQKNYFQNNSKVIHSDIQLTSYGSVQENDPLNKVDITLRIASLNNGNLDIQKSKIIYTYTDGSSEEKVYPSQDITPGPSRRAILPWWFTQIWYFILPVLAFVAIVLVLWFRKSRK